MSAERVQDPAGHNAAASANEKHDDVVLESKGATTPTTPTTPPPGGGGAGDDDEEGGEAASEPKQSPGQLMGAFKRRILLLALSLAMFLAALDITIVSTALPTIAGVFGASASEYAWVGSSYTLASTASTPIWAKMSDIVGRKSTIMTSNTVFMAGSLLAALSSSINMLIGGRILQGLGSGGMFVLVTILIGDLFHLSERPKYYALTGLVWALASSLGPLLGGVFTERVSWRWCFYINLPFEGVSLVVLWFVLKIDWPHVGLMDGLKSLDWAGSALIIGGTIAFLYGLETGASGIQPWSSAMVICLLVFGVLLLACFFAYEAMVAQQPLMPTRIFKSTTNIASFTVTCIHSFVFIGYDYFLPLYFQAVLGLTPIISGVSLFALVVPLSAVTFGAGMFIRRTGNYLLPIRVGSVIMTLGTGLFIALGPTTDWARIAVFQVVAGLGAGPVFQAPMISLQTHVEPKDVPSAISAVTFIRNLFTSMSIVIGTVVLQRNLGGVSITGVKQSEASHTARAEVNMENRVTYTMAMSYMWAFYTAVCGMMIIAAWFIKGKGGNRWR